MQLAIAKPFNCPVDLKRYPEYMMEVAYPMDLSLIKARVDNKFYRRIAAIQLDIEYIYQNAASFNRPKSDIVRKAKIVSRLCAKIIGDTTKSKDDVSCIYHQLSEDFAWSQTETTSSDSSSGSKDKAAGPSRRQRVSSSDNSKALPPDLNPKKWKKDCMFLLDEMNELPFSEPFWTPVSATDYPDYHQYIATPMDLSTVRESLSVGDYNSPLDFQKDVELIFKNSRRYNTNAKSKVLKMTNRLQEWFDIHILGLVKDWRNTNSAIVKKYETKNLAKEGEGGAGPSYKDKEKRRKRACSSTNSNDTLKQNAAAVKVDSAKKPKTIPMDDTLKEATPKTKKVILKIQNGAVVTADSAKKTKTMPMDDTLKEASPKTNGAGVRTDSAKKPKTIPMDDTLKEASRKTNGAAVMANSAKKPK